jgi:hypothetical protein
VSKDAGARTEAALRPAPSKSHQVIVAATAAHHEILPTIRDMLPGDRGFANEGQKPMANREVAVVIHDGVQALDVVGPLDVFAAANGFLPKEDRYRCLLVGRERAPVRS